MTAKYTYWMDKTTFTKVKMELESMGVSMREAKKTVCLPLSPKIPYGFVPPEAWSKFDLCRRQLSWYGASKFSGQFLLITEKPLMEFGLEFSPETIIKKAKFKPGNLPGKDRQAIIKLSENKKFHRECPQEFLDIGSMDEGMQKRWLKVMGIRGITYEELFVEQCANHANFMEPEYYLKEDDEIVPYSIGKTNRACSACLQFFNLIGGNYKKKYVVPCPGAALFAGMSVNKYYQVETARLFA